VSSASWFDFFALNGDLSDLPRLLNTLHPTLEIKKSVNVAQSNRVRWDGCHNRMVDFLVVTGWLEQIDDLAG
jgi:hypothetical protein